MKNKVIKTRQQKQEELVDLIYDMLFGERDHLSYPSSRKGIVHSGTVSQTHSQSAHLKKD